MEEKKTTNAEALQELRQHIDRLKSEHPDLAIIIGASLPMEEDASKYQAITGMIGKKINLLSVASDLLSDSDISEVVSIAASKVLMKRLKDGAAEQAKDGNTASAETTKEE